MSLQALSIPGLYLATAPVWRDERGYFREWFSGAEFDEVGGFTVRQANLSVSRRNVVRGLHYSIAPEGQAKVVTCAHGELDDVIVDVRVDSPTFGMVEIVHLSADEDRAVLVPRGAAHGFCVTSEEATIVYLLSSPYNPTAELEINPFDPAIGIAWPVHGEPIVSPKDRAAPTLAERRAAGELPHFSS